jgi:hypothetical protein
MWALMIIDGSPLIEGILTHRQVSQITPGEHFRFERSMKAFVFTLCLGVIRAAVNDPDTNLQQPDSKGRITATGIPAAPGRTIIGQDRLRQAITLENSR